MPTPSSPTSRARRSSPRRSRPPARTRPSPACRTSSRASSAAPCTSRFTWRLRRPLRLPSTCGAGKSTLIKAIAGIYPADGGRILWDGQPVHIRHPRDAAALGIETVYQDLALADNLDIVQNMFLGREVTRRFALDEEDMERKARDTLAGLRVTTVRSIRQPVASLSGGQRQSVAIAQA